MKILIIVMFFVVTGQNSALADIKKTSTFSPVYRWFKKTSNFEPLQKRVAPPTGYKRVPLKKRGFGNWLRNIPLSPKGTPVELYTGTTKSDQSAVEAVVDIDIGKRDRQQCADAVMRLRAEYLYSVNKSYQICFNGAGKKMCYKNYKKMAFRKYLSLVFAFANSQTLFHQMKKVKLSSEIEPGNVIIEPANSSAYGHAITIMDVAQNEQGEKVYLLSQSYMPAQSIHILKNHNNPDLSPWFKLSTDTPIQTPDWSFQKNSIKRFTK